MLFVPYIMFDGNAAEAIDFYSKVLGADAPAEIMYYRDTNAVDIPTEYGDKVLHAELKFPGGMLYISDAFPGANVTYTDSISFNLGPDSEASAYELFDKLSEGGKVVQPLQKEFWGALYGSVTDQFGIYWSVNFQLPAE